MIQKKEYPLEEIKFLVKKADEKTEEIKKYSEETEKLKYEREEKQIIEKRLDALKKELKNMVSKFPELLQKLDETGKTLIKEEQEKKIQTAEDEHYFFQESPFKSEGGNVYKIKELKKEELERETFRRLKLDKKRKEEENKKKSNKKDKNNLYSEISSKFFSKFSKKLLGNESFKKLEKDLIRANLDYAPTGYISIILFTTILSIFIGGFIFMFFLFFKIEATLPFIVRSGQDILTRFSKVVWILILAPIGTFLMMYIYPSLEKKAAETRINVELPFAAIHMAAISGSMINPVKIFEIIISTKEYPAIEKEFTKILNDINIYGSDLVSALKNGAKNTPSKKLSELLN